MTQDTFRRLRDVVLPLALMAAIYGFSPLLPAKTLEGVEFNERITYYAGWTLLAMTIAIAFRVYRVIRPLDAAGSSEAGR